MPTKELIATYSKTFEKHYGMPVATRTATAIAKEIGQLQNDGVPEYAIADGLDILAKKAMSPWLLASAVLEAARTNGPRGSVQRGDKPCPICNLMFQTEARVEEHLENVHQTDASTVAGYSRKVS